MFSPNAREHHKRFHLNLPVRIWFCERMESQSPSQKEEIVTEDTTTANISSGGCYFYLHHKPVVGTEAAMEITVPVPGIRGKESKIRCRGTILRVEEEQRGERVGVASTIEQYQIAEAA